MKLNLFLSIIFASSAFAGKIYGQTDLGKRHFKAPHIRPGNEGAQIYGQTALGKRHFRTHIRPGSEVDPIYGQTALGKRNFKAAKCIHIN
jgi:hypothetical protein